MSTIFKECRTCVAPRRHPGCHDKCPDYAKGKVKSDAINQAMHEDIEYRSYTTDVITRQERERLK